MEEGDQQNTNSQQYSADPRLAHQKVLRPSESFVAEVNAPQQPSASPSSISPEATTDLVIPTQTATDGQIPYGMSASQLGLNHPQRDMNWRSLLKPVLTAVIVLLVLGATFLTYRYLYGYGPRTVQGNGFTYTVTYNRAASEVTINSKPYLQGRDQSGHAMLLDVGKSVQTNFDCHTVAGGTISVIATPQIEGKQHNLCYSQALNAYEINFTHNGVW